MAEGDPVPSPLPDPSTQAPEDAPSPAPTSTYTPPPDVGKPETPPAPQGATTAPPDYGQPPTLATPPVTTTSVPSSLTRVERAQPVEKATYTTDDIIRMQQESIAERKREFDEYNKLQAPLYRWVEQKLKEPPPPVPQAPQTPPPPSEQESMNNLKKKTIGYLAVALPLAALMGARGGWAAAGAWGGLGRGLTALAEGNQQDAEQSFQKWLAIDRITQQKFENQMTVYQNTLANRNMTIQNMMDVIGFNAKLFGDKQVQQQADMNDWNGMLAELQKKQDAKQKYDQFIASSQIKIAALKTLHRLPVHDEWAEMVKQRALRELGHTMNPDHPRSQEEQRVINEYPLDKFWQDKTQGGKPDKTGMPHESTFGDEGESSPDEHVFSSLFSNDTPEP